ncbi:trypsin-like peptidase domain-containing protein [Spongiactinospora sp. TRM90649]|uniref:trypsin-like peptidase domain-containing protein n=1 Tax=Spongiactinospora sp. TRM90649 TaxID=3031114 RepID=UPI0023F70D30|nr:trypsin-like peptidase domain-containing protein [Spongiactinospora sp. TRM90649]MDF5755459.1 trypsin-like peptidase domain-containing protein [Spongiactinospora sp. TRM90649]
MTDEQRTGAARDGEGRTPSDQPRYGLDLGEPADAPERPAETGDTASRPTPVAPGGQGWGRPDFLPAGDAPDPAVESPKEGSGGWGNPSGDTSVFPDAFPDVFPDIVPMTGPTPYPGRSAGAPDPGYGPDQGYASGRSLPPPPAQAHGMGPGWAPPPPPPPSHGPMGGPGGDVAPPKRSPGMGAMIALAVVIALVAGAAGSAGTYLVTRANDDGTNPGYTLGASSGGRTERPPESVAGVARQVLPSVVSIEIGAGTEGGASGSGFLIKGGYVVTNNHVAAPAAQGATISLQFSNRKSTGGRVVGRDPGSDLAVIKPDDTFGMAEVALGDSDDLVVGDSVIAIGSPLGLSGTVTLGIISSLNRPVVAGGESGVMDTSYINAIQTDAAINPGNSGGPLVNGRGEVIGVNSAIATLGRAPTSGQGGSIGLGFAIPMNHARRVIQDLVTTGSAKTSRIGISIDTSYQGQGVRIQEQPQNGMLPVEKGGPADKAGLRAGDVITELNGSPVQNAEELMVQIRSKAPGDKISLKFQRGGKEQVATVTVAAGNVPTPQPS